MRHWIVADIAAARVAPQNPAAFSFASMAGFLIVRQADASCAAANSPRRKSASARRAPPRRNRCAAPKRSSVKAAAGAESRGGTMSPMMSSAGWLQQPAEHRQQPVEFGGAQDIAPPNA